MVHAKNYKTMSTFVKVKQRKFVDSFFPDTVYSGNVYSTDVLFDFHKRQYCHLSSVVRIMNHECVSNK